MEFLVELQWHSDYWLCGFCHRKLSR